MFGPSRGRRAFLSVVGSCATALLSSAAQGQDACFVRLDTGSDLTGWHVSTTNHHGPGAGWTFEEGALVGRQTAGQLGGILMTDTSYSDVEVVFEVKIDWGCDSGFFFRTTAGDRAYQVNVDHLANSGVGTIYGEGFAQELRAIPYFLTDLGNAAVPAPEQTPSFDLALWPTLWKPTEFNEIRARVEGNPPRMQVWISDVQVMDFTDAMLRSEIDAEGPVAIQVHSGSRWIEGGSVRFRNIRVKDLTLPCVAPEPSTGGTGGASGAAGTAGSAGSVSAGGQAGSVSAGGQAGNGGVGGQPSGGQASVGGQSSLAGSGATTSTGGSSNAGAPPPAEDSGCACRAARGQTSFGWSALVGGLALALVRRRRAP
jgi:Domain of Unknown Function (DUF1080)